MRKSCFQCRWYYPQNGDNTRCQVARRFFAFMKKQNYNLEKAEEAVKNLAEKCSSFKQRDDDWQGKEGYDG